MVKLPRGIAPELLISQVRNTMPYLFDASTEAERFCDFVPAQTVWQFHSLQKGQDALPVLSHFQYFKLCVSAHYLTCGTPVPTDVDNQIRHKLWPEKLPLETALEMTDLVLESRRWDFTLASKRFSFGAEGSLFQTEALSGHLGEWFTLSSAAYCALKQYQDEQAVRKQAEVFAAIADEVHRHSEIYGSLMRDGDGLGSLRASASIAHNFGDLDRVMDMWKLDVGDPLRLEFYKLSTIPFDVNGKLRHLGRLWVAGELYKSVIDGSSMALENHRHYALRKPKCLRKSPRLLIPTGPFFDEWGGELVSFFKSSAGNPTAELMEVSNILKEAWDRQPRTMAYGRALRSILEACPGLEIKNLKVEHAHRAVLEMSQESFERRWGDEALRHMDEIPSRA